MKTKITKSKGAQYLVVDDEEINNKSQYGSPITLAVITNYFDSLCWSFEDYRLRQHLIPSKYLNDNSDQIFNFNSYPEEDKKLVLCKIKDYTLSEEQGMFYWRYDGVDLAGDIPRDDKRRIFTTGDEYPRCACFTFKAAQTKLREAKEFWDSYEGSLTDDKVRLPNPYLQPHSASFYFELSFNQAKIEEMKKMQKK